MQNLPLRQRKHAQTKVSLLNCLLEKLNEKNFDDISVKELCRCVTISEVTFYNYFSKKTDLLVYLLQVMVVEANWRIKKDIGPEGGYDAIRQIFDFSATKIEKYPRLKDELTNFFIRQDKPHKVEKIPPEELALLIDGFDIHQDIETDILLSEIFHRQIQEAITKKQLPQDLDVDSAIMSLMILLIGMPVRCKKSTPLKSSFAKHLDIIWKGLGGMK